LLIADENAVCFGLAGGLPVQTHASGRQDCPVIVMIVSREMRAGLEKLVGLVAAHLTSFSGELILRVR
jgi:hypothetical protein